MARPSRSAMYADDPTFLWKAILRSFAILLAIVGIATTAWAMISHIHGPSLADEDSPADRIDYENDFFYGDFGYLPWQHIALGLSVLWNMANIVTLLARNRPVHPGANVACDLLLWLGLLFTGAAATLWSTNYLFFDAYDEAGYDDGDGFGGGTYSNGTQFEYTANGTSVPVAGSCDGFTTCAARDQYVSAVHHKGVVVAVGASMAFVVLLFHFALFISACRYTNDRRHPDVANRQARAITAEASEIARRMIADLHQGGGSYQQLHQSSEAGDAMEMRQRQSRNQQRYDYQPVLQQAQAEDGQVSREDGVQTAPAEAARRVVRGPGGETHPALRVNPAPISQAL